MITPDWWTCGSSNCPLIAELPDGDFLVIGSVIAKDAPLIAHLGGSVGDGEAAVLVPADTVAAFLASRGEPQ